MSDTPLIDEDADAQYVNAKNAALRLLSYRSRSEEEVRRLLKDGERAGGRDKHRTGVVALRATMQTLRMRTRVTPEDLAELTGKILEGEQPATWGSPVD